MVKIKRGQHEAARPIRKKCYRRAQSGIETAQRLKIAVCVMPITPLSLICCYYNVIGTESQPWG
ncbi:MAG: hypothetical protein ACI4V3_03065 [Faecousia sp.]